MSGVVIHHEAGNVIHHESSIVIHHDSGIVIHHVSFIVIHHESGIIIGTSVRRSSIPRSGGRLLAMTFLFLFSPRFPAPFFSRFFLRRALFS